MIDTVIFDMDDTLYDEVDYCRSGFMAVADVLTQSPGSPPPERILQALWTQFTSGNNTKTFNVALEGLGIASESKLIQNLVTVYRNHTPAICLPAESRNVLERLSGKYTLALLTDGFLPAQQLKVKALHIEKYFKSIIYTEQLGREYWKPSPVGFEKLLESIGTRPERAVYVADNEKKDFIAPNKLGILSIQLTRPARVHNEQADQDDAAAVHRIHRIGELPALLDRLSRQP
jgi:putative hydrolase of the HAD superfamily